MKDINKVLLGISCLLGGVVIGFLCAPIKKGMSMSIGNDSGNQYIGNPDDLEILKNMKKKELSNG
ncbi:hypothetical protein CHL78_006560 [Romboutsia weinsteinii]|uniref:Uncharacterized protein n=1 Tax=Romboutsia weinsteinii TaxID=2020949 RepID=A0A371J651_9FIRM|nr:hypothetical protein [Romboutsia weinsteinii]RDY28242.1 hypothetical protein CHL78_006560 [Romboutsia weinsteinii]